MLLSVKDDFRNGIEILLFDHAAGALPSAQLTEKPT
jgi:hypothetical protein